MDNTSRKQYIKGGSPRGLNGIGRRCVGGYVGNDIVGINHMIPEVTSNRTACTSVRASTLAHHYLYLLSSRRHIRHKVDSGIPSFFPISK